jgi:predicted nucleic acid-binding protein
MFLVDTNIISVAAPSKQKRNEELVSWLDQASEWLFLSVVTAAEIRSGISKAERVGASKKAAELRSWWQAIEHLYGNRLLVFDLPAADAAGRMLDRSRAYDVGFEDIVIAATAEVHGLTVLTANERHFEPLGVRHVNPLVSLPELPENPGTDP